MGEDEAKFNFVSQQDFLEALEKWESTKELESVDRTFEPLACLIGETITDVQVSDFEESIAFVLEKNGVESGDLYDLYAECCSETWFSEIIGVPKIIGHKVVAIEEMPLAVEEKYNLLDGRCRQEYDCVYGFRVRTNAGSAIFVFRNSSNGYYGGWLERSKSPVKKLLSVAFTSLKNNDFWMA